MSAVADVKVPLTVGELYEQGDPLDIDEGRRAAHHQALIQRQALRELETRIEAAAEAEHTYRVELAKKLMVLRAADQPVSIAGDLARGSEEIATLKQARDIAEGMVMAQRERVRELEGERAMLRELLEFSRRALGGSA